MIKTKSHTTFLALVVMSLGGCDDHGHDADGHTHDDKIIEAVQEPIEKNNHEHEDDHTENHQGDNSDTTTIRQADSHVHGDATLALALDGNTLVIELESPLYNLVGFERAPQSDAEKASLSKAQAALTNSAELFVFNPKASCTTDPRSKVSLMPDEPDDHHDDHGHEDEDHQDILLEYIFTCETPKKLTVMTTTLFDHFPEMSELDTIYLGPATQIQSTLQPGKNTLKLTK